MVKYKDYYIVFEEIPDMVSLAINIVNCQNNCIGCHSPELRTDHGMVLDFNELDKIINANVGINCVVFMGEGKDRETLLILASHIKREHNIKVAIYSGRDDVEEEYFDIFDYVKIGSYKEKYGPLNKTTTNQRLYMMDNGKINDITYKFWRKGNQ